MGGRMMRNFEECKYTGMTFDDRLGEWVCDVCGYVQVENFEETTISIRQNERIHDNVSTSRQMFY